MAELRTELQAEREARQEFQTETRESFARIELLLHPRPVGAATRMGAGTGSMSGSDMDAGASGDDTNSSSGSGKSQQQQHPHRYDCALIPLCVLLQENTTLTPPRQGTTLPTDKVRETSDCCSVPS